MSNYPNMSYCMCENTKLAMAQVLEAMAMQGPMFIQEMSRDEKRAYKDLFDLCEAFIEQSEELEYIIERGEEC